MSSQLLQNNIPIDEAELRALLLEYRRENWRRVQTPEMQERIVEDFLRGDASGHSAQSKAAE
jgi:hypothetical protein